MKLGEEALDASAVASLDADDEADAAGDRADIRETEK